MNINEKIELIKRNAEEIIGEDKLKDLLKKKNLKVYCGYEPSGEIHLGHLVTMMKLLDFQKAGVTLIILLADWHAWLNKKGDWKFLNKQVKVWEKGMKAAGLTKAKFIKGTNFQKRAKYIDDVFIMALTTTVSRGIRSMQTVARDIENAKISQIIYPLMQIEDIKSLNVDFVVAGIDQRKIHALGIELFSKINMKKKPVFIHTPLISSLKGAGKMSSSDSESFVSIRDSKEQIRKKINQAHCIMGEIRENPVLDICKLLIFPKFGEMKIERHEKYGGELEFENYENLENSFKRKEIHPLDLKNAVGDYLEKLIEPIRNAWR